MVADATYFSKIQRFEELYDDRVSAALSLLASDPKAVAEITRSHDVIKSALQELIGLYQALYVTKSSTQLRDDSVRLTRLEANITMTTQQNLETMQKLIRFRSGGSSRLTGPLRSRLLLHSMRKMNTSLARRDDAAPISVLVAVKQMLCAGRKPVKTSVTMIGLVGLHRPVSVWERYLDPSNFFRSEDLAFHGVDSTRELMARFPRRVLVIIGNHDTAVYDGPIAQRLAVMLGSGHHIVMTRKSVFPIPPPEKPGDVVYVDEDDPTSYPLAESVNKIKQFLKLHDVVSFAVYPEGMMAFTGAQMPLVTKEGAFVVARKLAIELSGDGIPVFLVETKTNTLEQITQHDLIEASASVADVEIVPATPLVKGKPDEWIEGRRLESENRFNEARGNKMLDIVSSTRIPGTLTYDAHGLSCERRG